MILSDTAAPATGPTCSLARVDAVECPASGRWTVARHHARVEFAVPRPLGRTDVGRGRAAAVTIVVGENPDDVAVAVVLEASGRPPTIGSWQESTVRLDAASVRSRDRWRLSGGLSVDETTFPVEATLAYHGVWRTGAVARGRFELSGTIDHGGRAKWRPRFCFALLAHGPGSSASERGAA